MQPYTVPLTVGVITGIVGFIMGALLQQDASYRGIQNAMETDPYIFQSRQQIYGALRLVGRQRNVRSNNAELDDNAVSHAEHQVTIHRSSGDHSCVSQDTEDSVFSNYVRWFQTNMQAVTMFFTFSLGDEPNALCPEHGTHVATLMKYGFPGLADIHVYRNFVLSYDRRNRIAHWVCEHLDGDCLLQENEGATATATTAQKQYELNVDSSIPLMFRASPRDYQNTDWMAGHMASPYNYTCDERNFIETYLMPNIAPVSRGLKSQIWSRLENYVRELAIKCGSVYVYTGPLFMPQRITFRNWAIRHQVIGMNTVAVPTHYFKVIIAECRNKEQFPYVEGYVVPNVDVDRNLELSSFLSDIRDIEHFAGLKFFDGVRWPHLHHNNAV
ncbi:endonuclease G, mitochondrial [Drosophila nasuta]|uniref:endonuclease G, mitochondrial n=1 Tax=Drosophila nasuta TaxID=42062 RepID=UPI00295ECBF5|nr:endonuclease G, mitochondrial [Drosophila nasuta]